MSFSRKSSHHAYIHEYPGSGPKIVLLHGLLASARYWHPIARQLQRDGHHVITIDLLGFGYAANLSASDYSYDEHVEHIYSTIQDVIGDEPFTLAGHSLGGLVAMRFARKYPKLVSQLLVFNSPFYTNAHEAQSTIIGTSRIYHFLLTSRYRTAGWAIARVVGFHLWGKHTAKAREGAIRHIVFKGQGIDDLQQLETKTVVVTGLRDRKVYIDNLMELTIPSNIKVVTAPTGHHLPRTKPQTVKHLIQRAITEMRTSSQS
ncbi:MAG TPA: alpha/beta hydrolase [Candidatus Saccharibacteria bacterium]|nr:alpha/beta hydrolase [Candidatus Saccharibacteria bacterium]